MPLVILVWEMMGSGLLNCAAEEIICAFGLNLEIKLNCI
jgi:hypothetical protein